MSCVASLCRGLGGDLVWGHGAKLLAAFISTNVPINYVYVRWFYHGLMIHGTGLLYHVLCIFTVVQRTSWRGRSCRGVVDLVGATILHLWKFSRLSGLSLASCTVSSRAMYDPCVHHGRLLRKPSCLVPHHQRPTWDSKRLASFLSSWYECSY